MTQLRFLGLVAVALLVIAPAAMAADDTSDDTTEEQDAVDAPSRSLWESDQNEATSESSQFVGTRTRYMPSAHFQRELIKRQLEGQGFFKPLVSPPRIRGILDGPRDVVGPMTFRLHRIGPRR